jgi:uronate dehydrogenase
MKRILMTGATGEVAGYLRPMLRRRYDEVVLSSRSDVEALEPGESFRRADLSDRAALARAVQGVDGIIHLGGMPVEADWDTILATNIVGIHTLYEVAREAGVRRIVFASSVHAIGFWPRHRHIGVDDRARPDTRYGLSKVFGEGLSSLYADKFGLRTLSVRIGACTPRPKNLRHLSIWLHPEDLFQLCTIGLEHPEIHNQIVFGASDNVRGFWDNGEAFRLGYRPSHKGEDYSLEALADETEADPVGDLFQGGVFTSDEFDGDLDRSLWA